MSHDEKIKDLSVEDLIINSGISADISSIYSGDTRQENILESIMFSNLAIARLLVEINERR